MAKNRQKQKEGRPGKASLERVSLFIYQRARHKSFGWETSPATEKQGAKEEPWRLGVGGRILGGEVCSC